MEIKKTVTIAICGILPRVGTTTQALQITAYLQMMGYDAAYIELAEQGYIEQMRKLYKNITVHKKCVKYERIPMYRSIVDANEDEPYDFLIKDYGSMEQDNFNQISFLEQDIQIICGGVKPNEIFSVNEVLRKSEYYQAKVIFSFVPPDQKSGIVSLMTNRAKDTFFANYNPDPFSFDSTMNKSYRTMLGNFMSGTGGTVRRQSSMNGQVFAWKNRIRTVLSGKTCKWIGLIIYTAVLSCVFWKFLR